VPEYVRKEVLSRARTVTDEDNNIISCSKLPFNVSYFSLQWSRAKKKMKERSELTILENETIYSFRHSAAINIYKRFKDVHLLQQLLGHSSIIVTLKYLRGLGELNHERMKSASPEL
jgi:integrase